MFRLIFFRYRKYNLYGEEDLFSKPSVPDVSYFDTDFMVRFGLLICFDINYQQPFQDLKKNQVDVILLPSAWVDELPFLTGYFLETGVFFASLSSREFQTYFQPFSIIRDGL